MSSSLAYDLSKLSYNDPAARIFELIERYEVRLNREFLIMVNQIKDAATLQEIEQLIVSGRLNEAFTAVEAHINRYAGKINNTFVASAESTADAISAVAMIDFDMTNIRAVDIMRRNRLEFVAEFMREQRDATRLAIVDGMSRGLNPRDQARLFRESIGLTSRQQQAVVNYRSLLETNSSASLTRRLRDRRYDRSVMRAVETGKPLTPETIDRMVQRYNDRYIKYRSEVIARTESLSSVHQGNHRMYEQAFEEGVLDPEKTIRKWHTARDPRVRDTHWSMGGQERKVGEPFHSRAGVPLMYPGDRGAPAKERIQ